MRQRYSLLAMVELHADDLRALPFRRGEMFFVAVPSRAVPREGFYFLDVLSREPNGGKATHLETWRYYPESQLISTGEATNPLSRPHPEIRRLLDKAIAEGRDARPRNLMALAVVFAAVILVSLIVTIARGRSR